MENIQINQINNKTTGLGAKNSSNADADSGKDSTNWSTGGGKCS